jgi:hypothetical protein
VKQCWKSRSTVVSATLANTAGVATLERHLRSQAKVDMGCLDGSRQKLNETRCRDRERG